jgi:hypothetical protein
MYYKAIVLAAQEFLPQSKEQTKVVDTSVFDVSAFQQEE